VFSNLPRQIVFDSGAPNRHGGSPLDVGAIRPVAKGYATWTSPGNIKTDMGYRPAAGKPATCRANYLCLDGHAETLPSDVAIRALVSRNW
jgi:hypothetical protein